MLVHRGMKGHRHTEESEQVNETHEEVLGEPTVTLAWKPWEEQFKDPALFVHSISSVPSLELGEGGTEQQSKLTPSLELTI